MSEQAVICPYCNQPAKWVNNEEIYGRRFGKSWKAWWCEPCDAYVGCHENSKRPKGSLANKATREARIKAHAAFDPLWKTGRFRRGELYSEITVALGRQIHIGESSVEQCQEIIEWCKSLRITKLA